MIGRLITVDGIQTNVSFKTFQQAIEFISGDKNNINLESMLIENGAMIINEINLSNHLPMNKIATSIAHSNELIYPHEIILGNVLIVDDVDEFYSLPSE